MPMHGRALRAASNSSPEDGYWVGRFRAMAGPCEVLIETVDADGGARRRRAGRGLRLAHRGQVQPLPPRQRHRRDQYRRWRAVTVDEETAKLLDFAATLHDLSDGLFDVTSGVLRRAWTFDGGTRVPTQARNRCAAATGRLGQGRSGSRPKLRLPPGMQLDFGGIGKEYAVDQAAQIARNVCGRAPWSTSAATWP